MIEVGDIVQVNINSAGMTLMSKAEVLYVPCATGDCWGFKDLTRDGQEVWTSEPLTIYKRDIP